MNNNIITNNNNNKNNSNGSNCQNQKYLPAISYLEFPFILKDDQLEAVEAWIANNSRGLILYSTGTGKTEIAFECAKRVANSKISFNAQTHRSNLFYSYYKVGSEYKENYNILEKDIPQSSMIARRTATYKINQQYSFFNILFLVPRISLIDQTINRLISYGISKEKIGSYFSEKKEIAEIIISTYQSIIKNPNLIRRSNMIIFDEIHLIRSTSKSFNKIFDIVLEDPKKSILGLTATLDEKDFRNNAILTILPPVKKYPLGNAVKDKRLAKPVIIPIKVSLNEHEIKEYENFSLKIKNISNKFKRYDANAMTNLLKRGGFASGMAKAWFSNVRKRKLLLSGSENKLYEAVNTIKKFPNERIMVFSETIESIQKLQSLLASEDIQSKIIDSKVSSIVRQRILDKWGVNFNVLLSIHTLEIGYDVPDVRIEIILATTSNMNQIVQRIGRVLRKQNEKDIALIYVIYVMDTKDDNIIKLIQKATQENKIVFSDSENQKSKIDNNDHYSEQKNNLHDAIKKKDSSKDKLIQDNKAKIQIFSENRIQRAYEIVETSLNDKSITLQQKPDNIINNKNNNLITDNSKNSEVDNAVKINSTNTFMVKSNKDKSKYYLVDIEKKTCTCPDYLFRKVKCKHILAIEMISV